MQYHLRQGGNEDDGDEGIKDLIDLTLRKMDLDRDGRVSFDDFRSPAFSQG